MQRKLQSEIDDFLVEGVILTLGNLRGTLNWFGRPALAEAEEMRGLGLARVDRQLTELEDRARAMHEKLAEAESESAEEPSPEDGAAAAEWDLFDGIWPGPVAGTRPEPQDAPVFRSRRLRVRRSGRRGLGDVSGGGAD